MAISAKRFMTLDEETNLAGADFLAELDNVILNSPNIELPELPDDLGSMIRSKLPEIKVPDLSNLDIKAGLDRVSKGLRGVSSDLKKYNKLDLGKKLGAMFPDTPSGKDAAAAFKLIDDKCAARGTKKKKINLGKPFDTDINCNGKKRKGKTGGCSASSFKNVLDKITGGKYKSTFNDLNNVLTSLVNLSLYGYDMNMCGVFSALSGSMGSIPNNVLSRAAGAMISELGPSGNVLGVLDLASSSAGLDALLEYPSAIESVCENFTLPDEIMESDLYDFSSRFMGGMDLLDMGWDMAGDIPSVASLGDFNDEVSDMFLSDVMNRNPLSEDALGQAFDDSFDSFTSAYNSMSDFEPDWSFA